MVSSLFRDFLEELYTSTSLADEGPMTSFLGGISLPHLSADQIGLLEAPLTTKEIAGAIAGFARSKSPVSDGLPI